MRKMKCILHNSRASIALAHCIYRANRRTTRNFERNSSTVADTSADCSSIGDQRMNRNEMQQPRQPNVTPSEYFGSYYYVLWMLRFCFSLARRSFGSSRWWNLFALTSDKINESTRRCRRHRHGAEHTAYLTIGKMPMELNRLRLRACSIVFHRDRIHEQRICEHT